MNDQPALLAEPPAEVADLPVHPIAALFPMMTEPELADLAADIKANGLRHPILLAEMISEEDVVEGIIDGRSRFRACQLAGIEPRFERIEDLTKIVRLAISENISRRHMSTGQIAMTLALMRRDAPSAFTLPDPAEKARKGPPQNPFSHSGLARAGGIPHQRISEAELVIEYAPELVDEIMANSQALDTAYKTAQGRKRQKEWRTEGMALLRQKAPEMAERVDRAEISFEEARTLLADSDKQQEQQRQTVFQMLADYARLGDAITNTPLVCEVPNWLGDPEIDEAFRKYFKGGVAELAASIATGQNAVNILKSIKFPRRKNHERRPRQTT
jgi:ParB-like chromosome segregation protein Spo0J